ncbi:MAG: O-antigen ligase family protein [Pseudomonadota bacterium]|nr:O-antigen ligase family protein [Pseudomonadota bacterium]
MAFSVPQSMDPRHSAFKLLTQVYLLGLPVLAFNLFRTMEDLRRVAWWWVASAGVMVGFGVATLLLFPFLGPDGILDWPLHHFGTLPPGPYPRLELSFSYPSTLANYLSVVVMLVLVGTRLGWFDGKIATALTVGLVLCAFFALTPSFGGLLFVVGALVWYSEREARPRLARAVLVTGLAMPFVGALPATATPILHPTAPYLIELPLGVTLAPAIRLLAWTEAVQNFAASPIFGRGIGIETVAVYFEQENLCSGLCVGDAHNVFLSFAVQTGVVGLVAMLAIIAFVASKLKAPLARSPADVITFGLAIAWLSGFALQGLVGSFEDARHLWIIFGLLLTASRCAERDVGRTAGI